MVQLCCAACGKIPKTIRHHTADSLRICTTCHNRASGVRGRAPCAICGRVLIPRDYDRQGRPRCGQCPPDPGVDYIEVICDKIVALDPAADRILLRELVTGTIRQRARRRQVGLDLEELCCLHNDLSFVQAKRVRGDAGRHGGRAFAALSVSTRGE